MTAVEDTHSRLVAPRRPRVAVIAAAILALALVASCGVPIDDSPRAVGSEQLLSALEPPSPATFGSDTFDVFMVGADGLLKLVSRTIEADPDAILNRLLVGPVTTERAQDISSALVARASFNPVRLDLTSGIAYVDMIEGSLVGVLAAEQKLAIAQIVYSITELPSVDAVVLSIEGDPIAVATDFGTVDPGTPLTKSDFASVGRRSPIEFPDGEPAATPNTEPTPITVPTWELYIWMITPERSLVAVPRQLERSPEVMLADLLTGPRELETALGITSALPPDAFANNGTAIDINEQDGTAFVNFGAGSLPNLADDRKLLATAQIVYTLTGLFEIKGVVIAVEGERQALPTDEGLSKPGQPLFRADFASLARDLVPRPFAEVGTRVPVAEAAPTASPEPTATIEPEPSPTLSPVPTAVAEPAAEATAVPNATASAGADGASTSQTDTATSTPESTATPEGDTSFGAPASPTSVQTPVATAQPTPTTGA